MIVSALIKYKYRDDNYKNCDISLYHDLLIASPKG